MCPKGFYLDRNRQKVHQLHHQQAREFPQLGCPRCEPENFWNLSATLFSVSNRAVKVKNENWTVHVHGDMTVMNKDEAAKLSAIFRNDKPPRRRRATVKFQFHLTFTWKSVHKLELVTVRPIEEEPAETTSSTNLKPDWVSKLSAEFNAEISEVENFKKSTESKIIPVSPLGERRKSSKGTKKQFQFELNLERYSSPICRGWSDGSGTCF